MDGSLAARMTKAQFQKDNQESAVERLRSCAATGKTAAVTQSGQGGKSKTQGMAKPQRKHESSKKTAPGYSPEAPPGFEAIAPVSPPEKTGGHIPVPDLKQQALEFRKQVCAGATEGGQTDIQSLNFRTILCKYYLADKCRKGDNCTFAHSKETLFPKVDLRKGSLCFEFTGHGCCKYGDNCNFAHGNSELRQPVLIQAPDAECMPMPKQLHSSPSVWYPDESMSDSTTASLQSYRLENAPPFQCFGMLRL